jgi:hypothetical protein
MFLWMPAGPTFLSCHWGKRAWDGWVSCERGDEAKLNAAIETHSREGHKPFTDFDHQRKEASTWPKRFVWSDSPKPGIYEVPEWSKRGLEAVQNKEYRGFSPTFFVDNYGVTSPENPARLLGAPAVMGGLTNLPAFREEMLPLWCAEHPESALAKTKTTTTAALNRYMKQETIIDTAALQAHQSQLEMELAAEREKRAALEAAEITRREQNADAAVERLKLSGAIAMLDKELAASYRQKFINDPTLIPLLARADGHPALEGRKTHNPSAAPLGLGRVTITREATRAALNHMIELNARNYAGGTLEAKRDTARDFARMYASEITPRLKEGDDIPLEADNSFGTLSQTLVSVAVLERLFLEFPLLKAVFTDFSDQIVNYGDTLKTRVVGIPSVVTYNQSTGWSNSDMQTTDVSMTYDQKKGVQIAIDDQTLGSTVRRLFEEIVPGQAYALGKDMVDYIYALITSAYTNTVTAAGLGTFGRGTVVDIGGILDDTANPEIGRTLLLNRPYFSALEKDPTIVNLAAFQRPEIIEKGTLPDVGGFKVIKAVNLPATAIGAATLKGFAFTRSAIVLASRLGADYMRQMGAAANGTLQVVTTPNGFSANLVRFVDNKLAAGYQRLEIIYSGSRGQIAAGAVLTDV